MIGAVKLIARRFGAWAMSDRGYALTMGRAILDPAEAVNQAVTE